MLIAEIGLNHLGNVTKLSDFLGLVGSVDAITVQVIADEFYNNEKYRSLKILDSDLIDFLISFKVQGGKIGIAIDDYRKLDLFDSIGVDFYKVLSKDMLNENLIQRMLETKAESIYLSTGMGDFSQIDKLVNSINLPKDRVKLIHTQLSNNVDDVNLKAIQIMKDKYQLPIAYGHHCDVLNTMYVSTAFKPVATFFYVKGDDIDCNYPDNKHAVAFSQVEKVIKNMRNCQTSIGDGDKQKMNNWA